RPREPRGRHLRGARRGSGERGVLSPRRARLRVVLAVPRADRPPGRGAVRVAGPRRRKRPALTPDAAGPLLVAVVIPARDEEHGIERVLGELPLKGGGWRRTRT